MKKILFLLLTGFLLMTSSSCLNSQNNEKVKIFIAWPGAKALPSYDWKKGQPKPTGADPALIERILEIAGYDYVYVPNYNYTKNGDVRIDAITDGVADISIRSITINSERAEKVNFSQPYYFDGINALVLKDSGIKNIEDLANKTVYATSFTTAYKWAIENLPDSKIVSDKNITEYIAPDKMLDDNIIDAYLDDHSFLTNFTKESPQLNVLDKTFTKDPIGIAVNKDRTELLNAINAAIDELKASGELEELTSKFKQ